MDAHRKNGNRQVRKHLKAQKITKSREKICMQIPTGVLNEIILSKRKS